MAYYGVIEKESAVSSTFWLIDYKPVTALLFGMIKRLIGSTQQFGR